LLNHLFYKNQKKDLHSGVFLFAWYNSGMKKIKSNPDTAVLILRLIIGITYLELLMLSFASFELQLISALALIVYFLGSILLILGLFTRSISAIFVLFILFTDVAFGHINSLNSLVQVLLDVRIWTFVAIWLIGSGKYSLDYKFFNKNAVQNL